MSRECVRDERARQREELLVSYLFPTQRREREREKRREKKSEFSFRTPRRMLSRNRFKGVSRSALPLWLH